VSLIQDHKNNRLSLHTISTYIDSLKPFVDSAFSAGCRCARPNS
jgi:hypothetical protein